jgi:phage tail sheath protein FI
VYVQEEASGAKPIEAASTSTACFVGEAARGRPNRAQFVSSWFQFKDIFGDLDHRYHMPLAVLQFFQNGGQRAYILRVLPSTSKPAEARLAMSNGSVTIRAKGGGAWGNDYKLQVQQNALDPQRFDVLVTENNLDGPPAVVEVWTALGGDESKDKFYAATINRDSSLIEIVPTPDFVEGAPTFAAPAAGVKPAAATTPLVPLTAPGQNFVVLPMTGGVDYDATVAGASPDPNPTDYETALRTLDSIPDFSILCIPGADDQTAMKGIGHVAGRRLYEVFYIVDSPGESRTPPPAKEQLDRIKDYLTKLTPKDSNAGLYFPWVEVPDAYSSISGATRFVPPSGMIAGLFARTDNTRGVWKAPAGTEATLLGAVGLACDISDGDQDALNPIGINCIRQFSASGIVVWGSRTLSTLSNPEYRYVPVRRTANFLKVSLYRGTQWVVFEPNDEPLWGAIRFNVNAFMVSLFRAGAFQGGKPDDAFFVKCDKDNNVQATIDQGQVHILIAFAPLKPAEFLTLHILQVRKE